MRKNGWAVSHANCPFCNSTETYISLYQDCRYCNKCDRTYDELDVERHSTKSTYSGPERRKYPRAKLNSEGNLSI